MTEKQPGSFVVREMGGGPSSIAFDYRITALRLKYENVRFVDRTQAMELSKQTRERLNRAGAKPQSHDPNQKLLSAPERKVALTPASAMQPRSTVN